MDGRPLRTQAALGGLVMGQHPSIIIFIIRLQGLQKMIHLGVIKLERGLYQGIRH